MAVLDGLLGLDRLDEILEIVNSINTKMGEVEKEMEKLKNKIAPVNAEVNQRIGAEKTYKGLYEKTSEEKATALDDLRNKLDGEKATALDDLRNKLDGEKVTALDDLRNKLDGEKVTALNELRNKLEKERDSALENATHLEENEKRLRDSLDAKKVAVEKYQGIYKTMPKCAVLQNLWNEKVAADDEEIQLLNLVAYVGVNRDFCNDVYEAFHEAKKSSLEGLKDDEIEFFKSVNEFYKKFKKIDFDVFVAPGSWELGNSCEAITYDEKEMAAKKDKKWKYAKELLVPMLKKWEDEGIYKRALVVASDMK